jgi:hypothetical protein
VAHPDDPPSPPPAVVPFDEFDDEQFAVIKIKIDAETATPIDELFIAICSF